MKQLNRRNFLKLAGTSAAALAFSGLNSSTRASVSANEKLNIALVGIGGQGLNHLGTMIARAHDVGDINIAAVCDVHTPRYLNALEQIRSVLGRDYVCDGYQDFRRILDRKDIDGIIYATPDHWHALNAIMSCQAGKDAYVEKPMTTSMNEGFKVIETARRYGRIVQVGIQQRSMEVFKRAIDLVHSGTLGNVTKSRAWIPPNHNFYFNAKDTPSTPPPDLDWDLWLGPAPWVPFSSERFGGFRAFHDYVCGGELANWGVHLMDISLWGLNKMAPLSVQALGMNRSIGDDAREIEVFFDFNGSSITWEQTPQIRYEGMGAGTLFEGNKGILAVDRSRFAVQPENLAPVYKSQGNFFIQLGDHHGDFYHSIRTRQLPCADCAIGHAATALCILGNLAVDLNRKLIWDQQNQCFVGDEEANRYLSRPYRTPWKL